MYEVFVNLYKDRISDEISKTYNILKIQERLAIKHARIILFFGIFCKIYVEKVLLCF